MTLWYFGNTTVRSALRLRDGLQVIKENNLQGKLHGIDGDFLLRYSLGQAGIVKLGNDESNSVGRKWRSAMEKMGFLIPAAGTAKSSFLSKNGHRLVDNDDLNVWQDCFLRGLVTYKIKDQKNIILDFSPFGFVLDVMLELENIYRSSTLSIDEMALFVQTSSTHSDLNKVINDIQRWRKYSQLEKKAYKENNKSGYAETTSKDYADTNFRYLKASGLFKSSTTSLMLDPDKMIIAKTLSKKKWFPQDMNEYLEGLQQGIQLPTDDILVAQGIIQNYVIHLKKFNINIDLDEILKLTDITDINTIRYKLETQLFELREKAFAIDQSSKASMKEILDYIDILMSGNKKKNSNTDIDIPSSERPAYFEWVIWRSFLAMNNILNHPWQSRNFKIDPDFKPISHARAGYSDLLFEFEDCFLVVEVTLTTSSRQEAAEGEPVRRHVADVVQKTDKAVYGLFIAISIDTNTANTFRLGEWFLPNDEKILVQIVPVSLKDFKKLLEAGIENPKMLMPILIEILKACRLQNSLEAPQWKQRISILFDEEAKRISST